MFKRIVLVGCWIRLGSLWHRIVCNLLVNCRQTEFTSIKLYPMSEYTCFFKRLFRTTYYTCIFRLLYGSYNFGVHCRVEIVWSHGYLVSEYTIHITYLLTYSEKLRIEIHKISFIFSKRVLQVVYGFVSSFQFRNESVRFRGMNKLV